MRSYLGLFLAVASIAPLLHAEDSAAPTPSPVSSPAPTGLKPATYFQANVDGPFIGMELGHRPGPETTPRLLDILKQRNIKATFFMIGQNAERNPDIVKRILADGHEIGNHSWTHPQLAKLSDERVTEEITKTQNAIQHASGYTPKLLRPPYGSITARQKEWIENQFGFSVIFLAGDPVVCDRAGAVGFPHNIYC